MSAWPSGVDGIDDERVLRGKLAEASVDYHARRDRPDLRKKQAVADGQSGDVARRGKFAQDAFCAIDC